MTQSTIRGSTQIKPGSITVTELDNTLATSTFMPIGAELDDIDNVTAPAPNTGDVLTFSGGAWINAPSAGGSVVASLDDLTDVVITSPGDNALLAYDNGSSTWIDQTASDAGLATYDHTHNTYHNLLGTTHLDTLSGIPIAGDLMYANATPKWGRLAKGADHQFLKMVSGVPTWSGLSYYQTVIVDPSGDGNFTTLSAAEASITDASISKRYRILIYGDVTETNEVSLKSYVDVQGVGDASITINTNSNVNGLVLGTTYGANMLSLKNLRIYRTGTTSGATYVISDKWGANWVSICLVEEVRCWNQTTGGAGHGMYSGYYSNTNFKNCEFYANNVDSSHGAVLDVVSTPIMYSCIFQGGTGSTSKGVNVGSSANPTMYNCVATGGTGASGGCYGMEMSNSAQGTFISCKFVGGNNAGNYNHGVYVDYSSVANFTGCTILGGPGAGLSSVGFYSYRNNVSTLTGCIIKAQGGGYYCDAVVVAVAAVVTFNNCVIEGTPSYEQSRAITVSDGSYAVLNNCSLTPGSGGVSSYAVNLTVAGGVTLNGCNILVPSYGTYAYYASANNGRFQPSATKPYQVNSMVIIVDSAQTAGSTLKIGTSIGGSEVASGIPIDSTGWKTFTLGSGARSLVAAGGYLYATPSVAAADNFCRIYYTVNFSWGNSYGVYLNSQGPLNINNCYVSSNIASDCFYIESAVVANEGISLIDSTFKSVQAASSPKYSINAGAAITIAKSYNLTMEGAVHSNVTLKSYTDIVNSRIRTNAIRVGSPTSYTDIDAAGFISFSGGATIWDDLQVTSSLKLTGVRDPTFEQWFTNGAGSRGLYLYSFTDEHTNEKEMYFATQMPHSWAGTAIHPHVHFTPASSGTAGQRVKWGLEYNWVEIGGTFGNSVIITTSGYSPVTSQLNKFDHYLAEFPSITPNSTQDGISTAINGRLFRNSSDTTNDTYTDKAGLLQFDIHFEKDALGSREEDVK